MKKIPSVFQRDMTHPDAVYRNEVTPGCEWVLNGEGVATRKWDGTAVLIRGGKLFARFDAKRGKTPPSDFEPAQDPDPITGHWPGWVPATRPQDKWIREALTSGWAFGDGTYEACGPKIGGNADGFPTHCLLRHGGVVVPNAPHSFDEMSDFLKNFPGEGIVFHHSDGRMAKATRKGFGHPWPLTTNEKAA